MSDRLEHGAHDSCSCSPAYVVAFAYFDFRVAFGAGGGWGGWRAGFVIQLVQVGVGGAGGLVS